MKLRFIAVLAACVSLSGCSTWDSTLDYVGLGDEDYAAPPVESMVQPGAAPVAQATTRPLAGDGFCDRVAAQERSEIAAQGADAKTQANIYTGVYNSCAQPSTSR